MADSKENPKQSVPESDSNDDADLVPIPEFVSDPVQRLNLLTIPIRRQIALMMILTRDAEKFYDAFTTTMSDFRANWIVTLKMIADSLEMFEAFSHVIDASRIPANNPIANQFLTDDPRFMELHAYLNEINFDTPNGPTLAQVIERAPSPKPAQCDVPEVAQEVTIPDSPDSPESAETVIEVSDPVPSTSTQELPVPLSRKLERISEIPSDSASSGVIPKVKIPRYSEMAKSVPSTSKAANPPPGFSSAAAQQLVPNPLSKLKVRPSMPRLINKDSPIENISEPKFPKPPTPVAPVAPRVIDPKLLPVNNPRPKLLVPAGKPIPYTYYGHFCCWICAQPDHNQNECPNRKDAGPYCKKCGRPGITDWRSCPDRDKHTN